MESEKTAYNERMTLFLGPGVLARIKKVGRYFGQKHTDYVREKVMRVLRDDEEFIRLEKRRLRSRPADEPTKAE